MKILIAGTHFTPAQAVIEEFKKMGGVQAVYVGRKYTQEGDRSVSIESQVLPKMGVRFIPIVAGRVRWIFDIWTVVALLKIPVGFIQSFYILIKESPDVVLSFGGYIGLPVVVSAWILSIPIIVHEQTIIPGLANKISSLLADKIAVSFDKKYPFQSTKAILTGNPIRQELLSRKNLDPENLLKTLNAKNREKLPLIYITGGNQGSDVINKAVLESLDELTKMAFAIHQTGDSKENFFEKLSMAKNDLAKPDRYLLKKWFQAEEVGAIFREADLVISRAGINTLLELAYFGVPTIIIPLPYIYRDEQNKNAKFFKKAGLCLILPQLELSGKNLLKKINEVLNNLQRFKMAAKSAKKVVVLDAAKKLALETLLLTKRVD